jgi:hypothetical protein
MKANTFKKIIVDAIIHWSSDTAKIYIKGDKVIAEMNDESEFEILVSTTKECLSDDMFDNYYKDE